MPRKIDVAAREQAVWPVRAHQGEYPSRAKAIEAVARQEGVESLRRWVVQAEVDAGERDGQASEEAAALKRLKAENRRLGDEP